MRKKYFTLLLMFSCFALFAQNNVNINVTDAISALAIENADVTLNSSTLQTDVNGDVVFAAIADGVYPYTITNDCYLDVSGSVTVAGAEVFETATMNSATSASVFIGSSSNMFGTFAEGNINLTDGTNTYNQDVTEFDNLVSGVIFGTYDYTFSRAGACDVTGTVEVGCSTIDSNSGNVPLFFLSEDATVDVSVNQVDNALTANATGASINYQWLDCNNGNAPIDGETNQTFTATTNGSYAVVITDAACGVSDTSICFDINSLSIDQLNPSLDVTLFPNPVKDNLTVTMGISYSNIKLEIYSITGQLVKTVNVSNRTEFKVNISDLSIGMYLVKLNAEGKVHTSKILKN
jgi:hypothetical protein